MKKIIMLIMGLFLISVIQAQVTIDPQNLDISQQVGELKTYSITITNSFDFNVTGFVFGNLTSLGFTFDSVTIRKNSSGVVNFTVQPTNSFQGQKTDLIQFKFLADIPTAITTYKTDITSIGFNPRNLIVRQGDTINWTNSDTIFHNVFSTQFNQDIQPEQSFLHLFNTIGSFSYVDTGWSEFNNFHGSVEVIGRTSQEEVHNPTHDFNWVTDINFFLNPTNLTYELLDQSFEIAATGKSEGIIRLKNTGTEIAEKIVLSSESNWISFSKNNFDVSPNEQTTILFEVNPLIFATEDTNKTYSIKIKVDGSNVLPQEKEISVFIPFTEVFTDTDSPEFIFALLDKFCKANPKNVFCDPGQQVIIQGNETNETLTLNITGKDFFDLKRQFGLQGTVLTRQGNDLQTLANNFDNAITEILNLTKSSLEQQEDNDRRINRMGILFVLVIFATTVFLGLSILFKKFGRNNRAREITEGMHHYQN